MDRRLLFAMHARLAIMDRQERQHTFTDLRAYCARDTLAMVRLREVLAVLGPNSSREFPQCSSLQTRTPAAGSERALLTYLEPNRMRLEPSTGEFERGYDRGRRVTGRRLRLSLALWRVRR